MHDGEEAGIKSATILVKGHNAYGWLKTESGVHRLVRISPFDSQCAPPHLASPPSGSIRWSTTRIEIDINETDVRIDTYRASGAGGQHVNTTEFGGAHHAYPDRHRGACQKERSQHKNRATAWKMLRARLYEAELKKREAKADAEQAAKTDIGWGHQIRSYVLQPYQLVKDLRTGVELDQPAATCSTAISTRSWRRSLAQRVFGSTAEVEDID